MGLLNDLINKGAFAPKNPLAGLAGPTYTPPASIARPAPSPAAPLNTQWAKPAVTTMPARSAPAPSGWSGGGGAISQPGNIGGGSASPAGPQMNEQQLGAAADVDSTFMDQKSMYANALKKYMEDYDRQDKTLERDAATAQTGIGRNREIGLTGMSEDFASRGLANSGMFVDSLDKADTQYDKQAENVTQGLTNAKGDLAFRAAKYQAENGENGTNIQAARREAYARLAAAQNLT